MRADIAGDSQAAGAPAGKLGTVAQPQELLHPGRRQRLREEVPLGQFAPIDLLPSVRALFVPAAEELPLVTSTLGLSKADKPTLLELLRRVGGGDPEANRHLTRLELAEAIFVRLARLTAG